MNWRDVRTDLIHVMDPDFASAWGTKIPSYTLKRTRCGVEVRVHPEGTIKSIDGAAFALIIPWLHTTDVPSCLTCIAQVRKHDVGDGP